MGDAAVFSLARLEGHCYNNVFLAEWWSYVWCYGKSLQQGHTHIFQSLPRLLTLYFDYAAACAAAGPWAARGGDLASRTAATEVFSRTGIYSPSEEHLVKLGRA